MAKRLGQKGFRHTEATKAKCLIGALKGGRTRGDQVALPPVMLWIHGRQSCYMGAAKRRGHSWELTEKEFTEITVMDCFYCGASPEQEQKKWPGLKSNGIDRIDNERGYARDNVLPCCIRCNRMKHTMNTKDFIALVKRIAERH